MKTVTVEDVRQMIASLELSVDCAALDPEKPLNTQGVDSLDMINLFFKAEQDYGVKISEEVLENQRWSTMREIAENLTTLIASSKKNQV